MKKIQKKEKKRNSGVGRGELGEIEDFSISLMYEVCYHVLVHSCGVLL